MGLCFFVFLFVAFEQDIRWIISKNEQGTFARVHKLVNCQALKNSLLNGVN